MLRAVFASLISFLIFLIIHIVDFHYLTPINRTSDILWSATFGLVMLSLILCYLPPEEWFKAKLHINDNLMNRLFYPLLAAILYGFLFLGYLEFYFTAERSITFRMLMIIDKEPKHQITMDKMFKKYDVPGIIDKRFADLTYGGYLTHGKDSYYTLTNKGHIILSIYRFTIDYLHLGSGEKKD